MKEIEKNSQYLSQVQGRAAKRTAEDDKVRCVSLVSCPHLNCIFMSVVRY